MGTITDKLNKLAETKSAIKTAIVNKGVAVSDSDTFASYASKIASISGSSGLQGIVFVVNDGDEVDDIDPNYEYPRILLGGAEVGAYFNDKVITTNAKELNSFIYPLKLDGKYSWSATTCRGNLTINDPLCEKANYLFSQIYDYTIKDKLNITLNLGDKVTDLNNCFYYGKNTESITVNSTSANITDMSYMFYQCYYLKELNLNINTSNCTNFSNLFSHCTNLSNIPVIDTSSGTNFSYMFDNARFNNQEFPNWLDTRNGTSFYGMFSNSNIKSIPEDFNTSKGTSLGDFARETLITEFPSLDFTNATSLYMMCYGCRSLLRIRELNTINTTNFDRFLDNCSKLIRMDGISLKSLNTTIPYSYLTGYSDMNNLRYALLKDFGTGERMTDASFIYWNVWGVEDESIPLSAGARQSLIDTLITYSYDRATAGYSTCTINLHANTKALLTQDEIAQMTAKGYTLA